MLRYKINLNQIFLFIQEAQDMDTDFLIRTTAQRCVSEVLGYIRLNSIILYRLKLCPAA